MNSIDPSQVTQIASNLGYGANAPFAAGMMNQESGFGSASPNVAQVTPSTAANPGFGMAPLSPADMNDPTKNVAFALDLARRKLIAMGKDPSDPANAPLLAQAQNGFGSGAGDPSYFGQVLARMGYQDALKGAPSASGMGALPNPANGPYQGQALPQMPADFGTSAQPPVQAPQMQQPGGQANPLVALGMGMMGGNGWHDAMARGGQSYQDALGLQQRTGATNAELQGETNQLNAEAPTRAAQAASLRADAWKALNPVVTPDQAAALNAQVRGQDVQSQDAMAQLAATAAWRSAMAGQAKTTTPYVDRGADGTSPPKFYTSIIGKNGQVQVVDAQGNPAQLPASATPQAEDQRPDPITMAAIKTNTPLVNTLQQSGTDADNQLDQLHQTLAASNQPGALNGPGFLRGLGRSFDALTGTSTFGNLPDEQLNQMMTGQGNWGGIRSAIHGTGGRLTQMEVGLLGSYFPQVGTSAEARQMVGNVMGRALQRQSDIASSWSALPAGTQRSTVLAPGGVASWERQANAAWEQAHPLQAPAKGTPQIPATPTPSNPLVSTPTAAPAAPAPTVAPVTGKTSSGVNYTFTPGG